MGIASLFGKSAPLSDNGLADLSIDPSTPAESSRGFRAAYVPLRNGPPGLGSLFGAEHRGQCSHCGSCSLVLARSSLHDLSVWLSAPKTFPRIVRSTEFSAKFAPKARSSHEVLGMPKEHATMSPYWCVSAAAMPIVGATANRMHVAIPLF